MKRLLGPAALACLGVLALPAQAQGPILEHGVAILQGLDKVTARVSPVHAPLDQPTQFGTLEVVVRACRETPPTEPPESAAFLEIRELPPASDVGSAPVDLFAGGCSRPAPPYRPWSTRSMTSGWSTAPSPWPPPRESRACRRRPRPHRNRTRPAPPRRGAARDGTAHGRLDRAELAQVVGDELRVQEAVAARSQALDQRDERDLAGVARAREHAFAKECRPKRNPVQPTGQTSASPGFDAVRVAPPMQRTIQLDQLVVQPGARARGANFGAGLDHLGKVAVDADLELPPADHLAQALGLMEPLERQDPAAPRVNPVDGRVMAVVRHRKQPAGVGAKQQVWGQHRHGLWHSRRAPAEQASARPIKRRLASYAGSRSTSCCDSRPRRTPDP